MARARRVAVFLTVLVPIVFAATADVHRRPAPAVGAPGQLAAAVAWPPSTSLLVGEVMTGGGSASDEFVEIVNAGVDAADLAGLELVYVTASGSTVTRKATWPTSTLVLPGRRFLVANAAGIFAPAADATYAGGFAATGGAVALRTVGGEPIDAIGWGDATSAFVEGSPASAPPADSSIERRPGGSAGNLVDTNDNAADLIVNPSPEPRGSGAGPVPPSITPSASPSLGADPSPTPPASPTPATSPTPGPSSTTAPTASPSASAEPSPPPSPLPSPLATPSQSPDPTPDPSPVPSTSPTPTIVSIASARALPDDASIVVEGVVTVPLGALEGSRSGFIADATAGIAVYLESSLATPTGTGAVVRVPGTLDTRYGQRVIRTDPAALVVVGVGQLPPAVGLATGSIGEIHEGLRVQIAGRILAAPDTLADGLGIDVDDGSGPIRVVVGASAAVGQALEAGRDAIVLGVVGQRDSGGTGTSGYRIHAVNGGDVTTQPAASPSPSGPLPSPSPSNPPDATASPSSDPSPLASSLPSSSPSATPSPTPTPAPSLEPSVEPAISIVEARAAGVGASVRVTGVVTAERGRIGHPDLVAIDDGTAAILVRLPATSGNIARGTALDVRGVIAEPYGQRELRTAAGAVVDLGPGVLVAPITTTVGQIGEALEARLVTLDGQVASTVSRSAGGDLSFDLRNGGATVRVLADSTSGVDRKVVARGDTVRLTGIVGQRASRKGRLDGYRVWLRGSSDVVLLAAASSPPTVSTRPGATSAAPDSPIPIARAILAGGVATIEGVVAAGAGLLDAAGRRLVVIDQSAGIEVLLPADVRAPAVGSLIRVSGEVGRAYGAPRIKARLVSRVGSRTIRPIGLDRPPGAAHEWRLVRIEGTVADLRRLGDRWRLELRMAGGRTALVDGLAGAGIDPARVAEGRRIGVVGIVRRPYPTATDRRYALAARSPDDIAVLASGGVGTARGTAAPTTGSGSRLIEELIDADLARLGDHVGRRVRVGGLVVDVQADAVVLDDGTAVGHVVLEGEAGSYLPLLEQADAINVTGLVRRRVGEPAFEVVATSGADITRVGDPTLAVEPPTGPSRSAEPRLPSGGGAQRGILGLDGSAVASVTGIGSLTGILLVSLGLTLLRRRRAHLRLVAHARQRLAALGPPPDRA